MVSVPFSSQWVLQAFLIKHTSYSAAVLCHSLWDFHSWAKWRSAHHWKATRDTGAICTTRRLEYFSWWPWSQAGDGMTKLKNEMESEVSWSFARWKQERLKEEELCAEGPKCGNCKDQVWNILRFLGTVLWWILSLNCMNAIPYYSVRGDIKTSVI